MKGLNYPSSIMYGYNSPRVKSQLHNITSSKITIGNAPWFAYLY
jgi:hypothetical protein